MRIAPITRRGGEDIAVAPPRLSVRRPRRRARRLAQEGLAQVETTKELLGTLPEPDVEWILAGGHPPEGGLHVFRLQIDDIQVALGGALEIGPLNGNAQSTPRGFVLTSPRAEQLLAPAEPLLGLAWSQGQR